MKKTLSIVLLVLLVFLAVACNNTPEVHTVHTWDEGKQTLAPTCTVAGTWTKTCTVCGITKDESIEATGHVHANLAKGIIEAGLYSGMTEKVNCAEDGYYYYRCDVCDEIFGRVVTPKEAKAAKMTVPHVIAIEGEYVEYLDTAKTDLSDKVKALGSTDKQADFSDSEVVAATEFAPKYQKALCKSCGEALEGAAQTALKKAVSTTDADYISPVGTWTYKNVVEEDGESKGNYTLYSLLVTEKSGDYSVEGYKVVYDKSKGTMTTTKMAAGAATLTKDPSTRFRSLSYTDTKDSNKEYLLSSNDSGYTLSCGGAAQSVKSDENNTITFEKDGDHTAHSWKVMNWKGVKTFESDNTVATNATKMKHYIECKCGVSYLEENCSIATRDKETATPTTSSACLTCGFKKDSTAFYAVDVTDGTTHQYMLVPKASTLDLSGTKLALFNGKEIEIKGWEALTNAVWTGGVVALTGDSAVLKYKAK